MHCPMCGRKVHCLNSGKGPLSCCGQPMSKVVIGGPPTKKMDEMSEAEGWSGRPKGWTQKSTQKFAKSLTGKKGTSKGFFDRCVERMKGKVDNPEGFCAGAKDEIHGSTYWRGKGKSPQEAKKDAASHQNVKKG